MAAALLPPLNGIGCTPSEWYQANIASYDLQQIVRKVCRPRFALISVTGAIPPGIKDVARVISLLFVLTR